MKHLLSVFILFITLSGGAQRWTEQPYDAGEFRIKVAFPWVNHITIVVSNGTRLTELGYLGESLGFEYSVTDNRFVELNAGLAMTSVHPVAFPYDKQGPFEVLSTSWLSSTYNHVHKRWTFGYGLNYSRNLINRGSRSLGDSTIADYVERAVNKSIGVTLNSFFRLGKTCNIGIIYKSSLLDVNHARTFYYDHVLSLEINWHFRLNDK